MMGRHSPAPLSSASFRNDEPVFGNGHQVREGFISPVFGDVGRWSGECIGRPANRQPADWEVFFPGQDPLVNVQLREMAFAWLNPTHTVLRRAGVFLAAEPMAFGTVKAHCLKLQALARRGGELGLGGLGGWDKEDWKLIVADQCAELDPSTVATYVSGVRALRRVAAVVSDIDPFDDPWDGLAATKVASQEREDESAEADGLSTPDIPPSTWWALLRAAWTYIHVLAPDIFSWREDFERRTAELPAPKPRADRVEALKTADLDALLYAWLADPGHLVPLLAKEWQGSAAGTPIWKTLSRIITNGRNQDLFTIRKGQLTKRVVTRRTAVLAAVGEGRCVTVHGPTAWRTLGSPTYQPQSRRPASRDQLDEDLKRWLADPDNRIPVRAVEDLHDKAGTPVWATLARQIWGPRDAARSHPCLKANRARSAMIRKAMEAGQIVLVDSTERSRAGWRSLPMPCPQATVVTRKDGTSGPWRTEITQGELDDELRMLRAACYIFIAALSMMRDSEVQEIERNPLVTYFGSPAITSRKTKLDPARPELFWWISEPVVEAIAVAEALSWHPTHLFATLEPPRQGTRPRRSDGRPRKIGRNGITPADEIDFFIERINTTRDRLGAEEIPAAHVRPHMFRKTMSAIAAREPDSEIAVGLQLKHAARRAMANRTSQAYGKMDPEWAKEFDQELEHAAALKLVGLLGVRRGGEAVAVGPGAARLHAGLDKVIETMNSNPLLRAQIADERVEAALLASEFPELHLGTINHCMFDAPQAECQDQLPEDQRGQAPLLGACEPARCRNSLVTRSHAPIWISEEEDLMEMAKDRRIAPPKRESVLIRLSDVRRVTDALKNGMGDNL
ncbi:hypothetical protein [Streptomyces evansiae]|uniref:hypothetical protein n=1 Tax=Streptomyces evansiae TaxID=3075535 RepID=UPI0028846DC4|nr:hypothetical protein [Streptomyces sp. DSM 41859]MDT0425388.1 hypothetical protein [Streptomyces sp. DSM 41859]